MNTIIKAIIIIGSVFICSIKCYSQCTIKPYFEPLQLSFSKVDSLILNCEGWKRLDSVHVYFTFLYDDSVKIYLDDSLIENTFISKKDEFDYISHSLNISKYPNTINKKLALEIKECKVVFDLNNNYNTIFVLRYSTQDFRVNYYKRLEVVR